MRKINNPQSTTLRDKAEAILKNKSSEKGNNFSESEYLKLIHELEVHQIELEMQNEEMRLAKDKTEEISEKYTDLYDFAPSGYFTLTPEGEILELNLCGAKMLGKERGYLRNKYFHLFLSENSKQNFNLFLRKSLLDKKSESCEVILSDNGVSPIQLYLTGIAHESKEKCFITAIDITARKETEEALLQSNERLKLAEKFSGGGIWDWDIVTGVLTWTPEFSKLFGLDPEKDSAGFDTWRNLLHPDDLEAAEWNINESIKKQTPLLNEYRIVLPSGEIRWINTRGNTHYSDNGEPLRMLGICFDITEKIKSEKLILESERRFRETIENVNMISVGIDTSGCITFSNDYLLELVGWKREEVIGKNWFETFLPDLEKEKGFQIFSTSIVSGKIPSHHINEIITRNGEKRIISWSSTVLRDDENNITGISSLGEDISKRILAENELRESELRFKQLSENSGEWIWEVDKYGLYTFTNQNLKSILGYDADEILNKKYFYDFFTPDTMESLKESAFEAFARKESIRGFINRNIHKNGNEVILSTSGLPLLDSSGNLIGYRGVDKDVTESMRSQEMLIKSEEKWHTLFKILPVGVSLLDKTGEISEFNTALTEILEITYSGLKKGIYQKRKYINSDLKEIGVDEFPHIQALKYNKPIQNVEIGVVKEDGNIIWTKVSAAPLSLPDLSCTIVTTDISERIFREQEIGKMKDSLQELNQHLIEIRENERAMIAREIHDQLGQSLTALKIDINWLNEHLAQTSEAQEKMKIMLEMITGIIKDVQRISSELRPSILDDVGLAAAIEWYCEEFAKRTELKVNLDVEEVQSSNIVTNLTLYRILQESLTNVIRHSSAKNILIKLAKENKDLVLEIRDDGIGMSREIAESSKSLGILGMFERVKYAGGKMTINTPVPCGTIIEARVPLD